ncbi:alpha/beta fold hydrolase [Pseudovibrio sp. Tun.PSC04-5.I4]|uniref:thioesterase II family protein n=1 Tax=Pseudovibrio sp. Tun.PSC04-5.I4 TaxID=1798213 RepID=UPI00088B8419|nr:alpha/beta fold hydrolase [Pseudovibrio sp. Tun.PSC04-5.I4]SDQ34024.1 Surfactin synthase thioesterase subunit [Pseudovibrio sp. Tun.PSC04-5.I4]
MICFPQAGGDTSLYNRWKVGLGDLVHVMPARFPGRGARLAEKPHNTMEVIVSELATQLEKFETVSFALLGSSMGGWVAYELAMHLNKQNRPQPTALFVLASASPFSPRSLPFLEGGSREEMIEELIGFNPDFALIAEHDELVDMLLPAIIGDFRLCQNYHPRVPWQVPVPIFAFAGTQDKIVKRYKVDAWEKLSSQFVSIDEVDGGHFFIEQAPSEVLAKIKEHAKAVLDLTDGLVGAEHSK